MPSPVPDSESPTPAVDVQQCRLRLGATETDHVEFHLDALRVQVGEQVALTGPSGCGKSTLLNLVAGLLIPQSGRVTVHGADLGNLSSAQRDTFRGRRMGIIYQSFNLLDGFTAIENVLIGLRFGRTVRKSERHVRARELLRRVGLERRINVRPARLSVGERQRVAFARAIANRPSLLLADEPTGSLDPVAATDVFGLLRRLCEEERCTLLLVTHDHDLANQLPRTVDCSGLIQHRSLREVHA